MTRSIGLLNTYGVRLLFMSLCINSLFLFFLYNKRIYFSITQAHGQIAYNWYHYNRIGMDHQLTQSMVQQMHEQGYLIDYASIVTTEIADELEPFPINDTVAYGLLLGTLWKITHSLQFKDLQILQLVLFSILMLFYFQVAYLLFDSVLVAYICGIMHLLFFPLIAYNVMPVRDVWAYYGLLLLLYAITMYATERISYVSFVACICFVALCQWIRPVLSFAVIVMTIWLLVMAWYRYVDSIRTCYIIGTIWCVTGVLFWLPYMYCNTVWYGQYFVAPAGQSLLEGLGELPNSWGHQLNDEYIKTFIGTKYNLKYGTVQFDQAAMHEFKEAVKEDPLHYMTTLLYRLPDTLLPGLQWIFYEQSLYGTCTSRLDKFMKAVSSWTYIIDLIVRHLLIRLYLLLGYAGLYLLLRTKQYMIFSVIVCCLVSGLSTYPSHIEYRYIVPFYSMISLSVGYLVHYVCRSGTLGKVLKRYFQLLEGLYRSRDV